MTRQLPTGQATFAHNAFSSSEIPEEQLERNTVATRATRAPKRPKTAMTMQDLLAYGGAVIDVQRVLWFFAFCLLCSTPAQAAGLEDEAAPPAVRPALEARLGYGFPFGEFGPEGFD